MSSSTARTRPTTAPTATDQSLSTPEDTALPITLSGTDPDGDALTFTYTQPSPGTVTGTAPNVTYQPSPDTCGTDSFTFTVSDWNGATDDGTITDHGDLRRRSRRSRSTTRPRWPRMPRRRAIAVLANDTDVDGGPKTIATATDPANGTVVLRRHRRRRTGLTYQPDPNYCNTPPGTTLDTFTYTLAPGGDTGLVSITVTCVDDAPVAVDDTATVVEDAAATAVAGPHQRHRRRRRPEDDRHRHPARPTAPSCAPATAPGSPTNPNPNYCNTPPGTTLDTFTYTLAPGGDTGLVSITVTCVDDVPGRGRRQRHRRRGRRRHRGAGPHQRHRHRWRPEDHRHRHPARQRHRRAPAPPAAPGSPTNPTPTTATAPPATTLDTFTYTLAPGGDTGLVSITVTCVDDAPVAVDDTATMLEDATPTAIPVLTNDTDIDAGPKTIGAVTHAANGTVVVTGARARGLTYQPASNYCNNPPGTTPDTFTYTLNGGRRRRCRSR